MIVKYERQFNKDINKILDKAIYNAIYEEILITKNARNVKEINIYKKLKGYKNAYTIRIGDYRLGIYIEKNLVEFIRILHRKDFYKFFPPK